MAGNDTKPKPLNLDELFGDARAVKIIHNEREYEFLRIDAMGPKQAVKLQKFQRRALALQLAEELSDEQAVELEELTDGTIALLCPEFPVDELTFAKKIRAITFYMEETQGKKAMEAALAKVTGETPSQD